MYLVLHQDQPLLGPYRIPGNLLLYTTHHYQPQPVPTLKRPREEDVDASPKRRRIENTYPVLPVRARSSFSETRPGVEEKDVEAEDHAVRCRIVTRSMKRRIQCEEEVDVICSKRQKIDMKGEDNVEVTPRSSKRRKLR